jgi:hypothetical protein
MAKRSCDSENREESRLSDFKPQPKSSQLDDIKNEQTQLKLYNLNSEQQTNLSSIHALHILRKRCCWCRS